jgi:hypothetical protein
MFRGGNMGMTLLKPVVQQLEDHFHPEPQPSYFEGAVETIDASEFPTPLPPAQPSRNAQKELLARLGALNPQDAATKKRVQKAIVAAMSLLDEVREIETALDAERMSTLRTAHKDVRAEGRKLLKQIEGLERQAAMVRFEFNEANKAKSIAGLYLRQARDSRKKLSRWASDEELAEADSAIVEATEVLHKATLDVGAQLTSNNGLEFQIAELRNQLAKLSIDELRLRGELSGKPYQDPELGLTTAPIS